MNKKKLIAVLTLLCFMFTLMPVAAMAGAGTVNVNSADELKTAIENAKTGGIINLAAGEYKMPSNRTVTATATIIGNESTVIDVTNGAYWDNVTLTFEGITFKVGTGKANGNGSDYAALYSPNVTYKNCTFIGPMRVGRDGTQFIGCTFKDLGNDYIWTYGNDVAFEGCTFNTDGKAILIYSDGGNEVSQVSVKNCTFNATAGKPSSAISNQNCAAIEIHNYGNGVNLTTEGNTYDSNFSGEWRIKKYETGKQDVIVNAVEYTTIAIDGKTMTIEGTQVTVLEPVAKIGDETYTSLQNAIDAAENGDTVTLLTDVKEDVTVTQKSDVKFTIDGNDNTLAGSITVNGKSARYETAGVTIKNVNFNATAITTDACINLGNGDNNTRYTNNVTVENCTFTGGEQKKVAIKSYTGGDKNLVVTGCTVDDTMHSLLQVANVEEGLVISDCIVESKNGVNLNNTESLVMTGCKFNVRGYAVRAGVKDGAAATSESIVLENNVLQSACEDGDAVVMLRDSAANANIDMTYNAVMGTTHISGTTAATTVNADANYWDGKEAPTVNGTAVEVASYYTVYTSSEDGAFTLSGYVGSATGIALAETASVQEGKTITLTATLVPEGASASGDVEWKSSNKAVATVENGVVKGIAEGTAIITAACGDLTATCTVTVTKASSSGTSSSGGGFSGKYNYAVNVSASGADVTLSDNYATAGETVTITIDPDAGKQVDEVIVTDADGDVITVTKVGDNKYSFVMPAGKVNVSVTTENADYDQRIVMQIGNKNVVNNNKTITNDVSPVIVGDRTLVPVRIVTELLGGTADWDEATRTVTLTIDGKVLKLVIGQEIPGYGTGATIINDRTYVPIRYISEMLGANVEWIAATQQIVIEK